MATPVSIGNFVTEIVNKRGGPSNPTLYEFDIAPSSSSKLKDQLKQFGFDWDQELKFLNYLNNEIQIPGVTWQNSEVRQYRKGVPIKMASSKIFNEMDLTFICDVTSMPYRFFRGWIDYVGDTDRLPEKRYDINNTEYTMNALNYYYEYTCDFRFKKIEKKPTQTSPLKYELVRAWPYSVASLPMSHASQNGLVKLSVSMYYEYARAFYSPSDK